uniref:Uncharacterized protein n=1 Tax=viral metagenome TaxID=1070528 RepID=A0A6M3LWG8_9ZZZZ
MSLPNCYRYETTGHTRYFVPICIRGPNGFYGGPAGYQEIRDRAEAESRAPIILEPGKPEFLKRRTP